MTFPSILATASSVQNTNSTTHSMSLPAGIQANELIVAIIASDDRPSITGGFDTWGDLGGDSPGNDLVRIFFFFLRTTGSEGSSITFTTSTAQCTSHRTYRISGAHESTNPFIGGNNAADASTTLNVGANNPSTWDVEDTLWIFVCASNNGTISTSAFPTSYTNTGQGAADGAADGANLTWATRNNAVASEDPSAITFSASTASVGALIAIRPSAVTTITPSVISTSVTFFDPLVQNMTMQPPLISATANLLSPTINLVIITGTISATESMQSPTVTSLGTQQNLGIPVINAAVLMQQPTVYHLVSIVRSVIQGSDDAIEIVGASPVIDGTLLSASSVSGYVGVRFQDVAVPKNAVLSSAFVTLVIGDTNNDAEGSWYGEAIDDSVTFSVDDGSVDGRTKTSTSVAWTTNNLGNAGDAIDTPSLISLVSEIVNRSGWVPHNDMAFLYVHNSSSDQISFASFENVSFTEPKLTINYLAFVQTIFAGTISAGATLNQPNIGFVVSPGTISASATLLSPTVNLSIQYVMMATIVAGTIIFDSVVFNATLASSLHATLQDISETASLQDPSPSVSLNDFAVGITFDDLVEATLFDQES